MFRFKKFEEYFREKKKRMRERLSEVEKDLEGKDETHPDHGRLKREHEILGDQLESLDRESSAICIELPHSMMKSSCHLAKTAAGAPQVEEFTELVNMGRVVGERSNHECRAAADSQGAPRYWYLQG